MKNLLEVVKIFVLAAVMMIPVVTGQASNIPKYLIGTWYDGNGNVAFVISNDYINGCKIVNFIAIGGGYEGSLDEVTILEKNGYRTMRLLLNGYDYHQTLIVDKKYAYQKTKSPQYFESIGGIYLGMSKNQVLKLYGNPSSKKYKYAGTGISGDFDFDSDIWKYDKDGFEVKFTGDFVFSITMYPNSNRKFDKSGLSANDSNSAYERKYNAKIHGGDYIDSQMVIGHGESIFFNKDNSKTLGKTYG